MMKYLVKGKEKNTNARVCVRDECLHFEGCTAYMYCPFPDGPKTIPSRKKKK